MINARYPSIDVGAKGVVLRYYRPGSRRNKETYRATVYNNALYNNAMQLSLIDDVQPFGFHES